MKEYNEGDILESRDGTKFIITSREASIINCVLEKTQTSREENP